jgi:predicted RNA binding protein YcfA (HicA-like mRNA interferase family)
VFWIDKQSAAVFDVPGRLSATRQSIFRPAANVSLEDCVARSTIDSFEVETGNSLRRCRDGNCLAFCKIKGQWRLGYSLSEVGDPDDVSPEPVLDCSREVRLMALRAVPVLMESVVARAQELAAEMEAALGGSAVALHHLELGLQPRDVQEVVAMKVREVVKLLDADGWYLVVARGNHRQFKHPNKSGRVTVAGKLSDDVPLGTLNSILKQAGLRP